jgi:hypothetical protein
MRRELLINWSDVHLNLKREAEKKPRGDALDVGETGKGWSYVTFFRPGTRRDQVLFNLNELEDTAQQNGYFLPWELVSQHNKVVVSAFSHVGNDPSVALFGLVELLQGYAKLYADSRKYPHHGFYGKVGGVYDRAEKGRVLALYASSDDDLLLIQESLDDLMRKLKFKLASFDHHLSNGLSDIPRILDGYNDPEYRGTGATHFRITDPNRFESLVEQARRDYGNYIFE